MEEFKIEVVRKLIDDIRWYSDFENKKGLKPEYYYLYDEHEAKLEALFQIASQQAVASNHKPRGG